MMDRLLQRWKASKQRGSAIVLALMSLVVLTMMGASFALMVQNEASGSAMQGAYDQALYVAEAGLQDVLYQRAKKAESLCFPFDSDGGVNSYGVPAGHIDDNGMCATDLWNSTTKQSLCHPYNEKLYANILEYGNSAGGGFECNDGSDPSCPYNPVGVWPAKADGSEGWRDMDGAKPVPLADRATSSGQRYTTSFFTLCNDNCNNGEKDIEPGKSRCCLTPPCPQHVIRLSVVSVGEVDVGPGRTIRRAVKVDILPAALYSGVIDKYVDMTMMYSTDINGPIHINGWWANNQYHAFLLTMSASLAPLLTILDPPDMVSVSFPEDPANPDWQPPLGLSHITWVHLPIRLEIPDVNWKKWEDRMKALYTQAATFYANGYVHKLHNDGDCSSATPDDEYCDPSLNPLDGRFLGFDCPKNTPNPEHPDGSNPRIHNCRKSSLTVWNNTAIDLYDVNTGNWKTGARYPTDMPSTSDMDESLGYKDKDYIKIGLNAGCGFSNLMACLIVTKHRPEFAFMGKHEFNGLVFIDGTIMMSTRTPYHTCGTDECEGSGFCIDFPYCFKLGELAGFSFQLGIPHWHLGETRVNGEVLVNGRLFMGDWVRLMGGSIYAARDAVKDETSGIDLSLDIKELLCFWMPTVSILGISVNICDLVLSLLDPLIKAILPWWPTIDLSNNGLWDNKAYLDLSGNSAVGTINPGTLFTRGDFIMRPPDTELTMYLIQMIVDFIPSLKAKPAVDPVRIFEYGAIVAGGRFVGGQFYGGDIDISGSSRMDIVTCTPGNGGSNCTSTGDNSTGYALARGRLMVGSDIIGHYGLAGIIDNCTAAALMTVDANCEASGIFYSQGMNGLKFNTDWGPAPGPSEYDTDAKQQMFTQSNCLNPDDPGFWTGDPLGEIMCWARGIPYICGLLGGDCSVSEFNIRGHVFAGAVGGMPKVRFRLDQDPSVRHEAVTRNYFKELGGTPLDWMEIYPPSDLPKLQ